MTIDRRTFLVGASAALGSRTLRAEVAFTSEVDRLVSAVRYAEIYQAQARWVLGKAEVPTTEAQRKFNVLMDRTASVPPSALRPVIVQSFAEFLSEGDAKELAEFFELPVGRTITEMSIAAFSKYDGNLAMARGALNLSASDRARYAELSRSKAFANYSALITSRQFAERLIRRLVASPAFADLGLVGTF
jgi:hypothetical protein